jgi:hypothetical protein
MDERITGKEWDAKKRCPICIDIGEKNIPLEGEIMTHPQTDEILKCPICDHAETRMFHEIGGVEGERTSTRGDTQAWTHVIKVQCMSCDWKHVVANNVCLGDPWDEVMGFNRHFDQNTQQKHAISWTNEQAVGLRGAQQKYNKEDKLYDRTHRQHREIHTESSLEGSKVEWKPTKEEKKLPKFAEKKKDNL